MSSVLIGDTEEGRAHDRIKAIAFKRARDCGAEFITRKWIASELNRSESWVRRNWGKCYADTKTEFKGGAPDKLSQESKNIVHESSGRRRKSSTNVAKEIQVKRQKVVSRQLVDLYRKRSGLRAFHEIRRPKKSRTNIEDRLWFANFLSEWDEDDFLHVVPSDEFFVYLRRRPNFQNDRIWAQSISDIEDNERIRELEARPKCIGIFICFSSKSMIYVLKPVGQSWDGEYFRNTILEEHVIPFLHNERSVLSVGDATFLHDRAPCMKALQTQEMLRLNEIDFFDNSQWPGNSPDLNPTENLGAILKDRVEQKLIADFPNNDMNEDDLRNTLIETLEIMKSDTELFERLLRSFPDRLEAVRAAGGGHTDF